MIKYEQIQEIINRKKQVALYCDICGKEEREWELADKSNYYQDDVEIRHKFGTAYPSGGSGEELDLDICPLCFTSKILPYIREISELPIEYKDWDY